MYRLSFSARSGDYLAIDDVMAMVIAVLIRAKRADLALSTAEIASKHLGHIGFTTITSDAVQVQNCLDILEEQKALEVTYKSGKLPTYKLLDGIFISLSIGKP